jgi:RIP metalloprotease RseP
VVLSDPNEPLTLTYERTDPVTEEKHLQEATIQPRMSRTQNVLQIGVAPPLSTTIGLIVPEPALPDDLQPQVGDEIIRVGGQEVESFFQVHLRLASKKGRFAQMLVHRPIGDSDTEGSGDYEERTVKWRARINFQPEGDRDQVSGHLLGLVPRIRVTSVESGSRAEQAGLKPGDVIARWGNQISPRLDEIRSIIRENPETEVPVEVLRYINGRPEPRKLTVRARVPGVLFKGQASIGATIESQENDRLVVADVVAEHENGEPTPTAELMGTLPRGSLLTKVNGRSVKSWAELAAQLITLAGTEVTLSWTYENQPERSGTFYVPHTLGTTFELPGARRIRSIDGLSYAEVEHNGRLQQVPVDNWRGAQQVLSENVGETVSVEYWDQHARELHTEEVEVTPEMVDTWVLRIQYSVRDILTRPKMVVLQESNPAQAMMIGLRKTYHFIVRVYMQMNRMIFTRSLGLDQISGPVGIIKMGGDIAAAGMPVLLYFLALISANFAVLNFLPLPILDGGMFVFLIIEKIKGEPVSLKVQVATQLIGLTLIIGIFLFVTFQDIAKIAGWG